MSTASSAANLPEGIEALAQESSDRSSKQALQEIAKSLKVGANIPDAVGSVSAPPKHLAALLLTAGERGQPAVLITRIAAGQHRARHLGRSATRGLVYPVLLLLACAMLALAFGYYILTPLNTLLTEFELRVPRYVARMHAAAIGGGVAVLSLALLAAILGLFARLIGGRSGWSWYATHFPVVGLNYHWAGIIEWLDVLHLLVDAGRPMPDALRDAAEGIPDRYVSFASERIALKVEQGLPFWQAYAREPRLPASLSPFLRAGEERGYLPDALATCSELLHGRLDLRVQVLERWAPALISCLAALFITWLVMGVFAPLFGLIRGLSGAFGGGGMNLDSPIDTFYLGLLFLPGAAVLLARRILRRRGVSVAGAQVDLILSCLGWLLVSTALTGMVIGVSGGAVLVAAVLGIALTLDAVIYARRAAHRSLLWTLASASKRQIPFPEAVRALSDEHAGSLKPYADRFAENLERGLPVDTAAREARLWLPREMRVALAWAGRTGVTDDVLRESLLMERAASREFRRVISALTYGWVMLLVIYGVLSFVLLRIVPMFARMFEEFGLLVPAMTTRLIDLSSSLTTAKGLGLSALSWLLMLFLAIVIVDCNIGLISPYIPPFSFYIRRYWGAQLLRTLSSAIKRGFRLNNALQTFAQCHPLRYIRLRLVTASKDIELGKPAWTALTAQGLISQRDAAVLMAAERAGNLEWALEEMADSSLRRQGYRLRLWYNVLFPGIVLALGIVVAYIMIALFIPLPALIQGLSGR